MGVRARVSATGKALEGDDRQTDKQAGRRLDLRAPRPNFVAVATRVGPQVQWITEFPRQSCRAESATTGGDMVM